MNQAISTIVMSYNKMNKSMPLTAGAPFTDTN